MPELVDDDDTQKKKRQKAASETVYTMQDELKACKHPYDQDVDQELDPIYFSDSLNDDYESIKAQHELELEQEKANRIFFHI